MPERNAIHVHVLRQNQNIGDKGGFQDYIIQTDSEMTVMMILLHIFRNIDNSLAFRDYK